jgi:hypothetical protein
MFLMQPYSFILGIPECLTVGQGRMHIADLYSLISPSCIPFWDLSPCGLGTSPCEPTASNIQVQEISCHLRDVISLCDDGSSDHLSWIRMPTVSVYTLDEIHLKSVSVNRTIVNWSPCYRSVYLHHLVSATCDGHDKSGSCIVRGS